MSTAITLTSTTVTGAKGGTQRCPARSRSKKTPHAKRQSNCAHKLARRIRLRTGSWSNAMPTDKTARNAEYPMPPMKNSQRLGTSAKGVATANSAAKTRMVRDTQRPGWRGRSVLGFASVSFTGDVWKRLACSWTDQRIACRLPLCSLTRRQANAANRSLAWVQSTVTPIRAR